MVLAIGVASIGSQTNVSLGGDSPTRSPVNTIIQEFIRRVLFLTLRAGHSTVPPSSWAGICQIHRLTNVVLDVVELRRRSVEMFEQPRMDKKLSRPRIY